MVYKRSDKNSASGALTHTSKSAIKSEITHNQQLAEKFHEPII